MSVVKLVIVCKAHELKEEMKKVERSFAAGVPLTLVNYELEEPIVSEALEEVPVLGVEKEGAFEYGHESSETSSSSFDLMSREELKAELAARGIQHTGKQATTTYIRLLTEFQERPLEPDTTDVPPEPIAEVEPDVFGDIAARLPLATKEQVRAAMMTHLTELETASIAAGRTPAQARAAGDVILRGVLKRVGGVESLGKVDPSKYAEVIEALTK